MDRHVPLIRGEAMLSPAWALFLHHLAHHPARVGLRNLARWCDARGLAPEAVTDASLRAFLAEDAATRLSASVTSLNRSLPAAWNRARTVQPDPAHFAVLVAPRRREPYTKPFDWYLPSFAADVERYRLAISRRSAGDAPSGPPTKPPAGPPGRGPRRRALMYGTAASGRRAPRRLAAASVHTHVFALRQAAAALLEFGVAREELRTLSDLVVPLERAADVVDHYEARGLGPASLKGIANALRAVAEHHVGLPECDLAVLRGWTKEAAGPRRKGMTLRNRERLARLLVPRTLARFLRLPERVAAEAATLPPGSIGALRLLRNAVIADVLVCCPLRLNNLRHLRLDQHLLREGKGGRITHFIIPANQTKTGEDIFWPLRKTTSRRLTRYLREVRPRLAQAGNTFLFPGVGDAPMSASGLRSAFSETVERYAGAVVNPHLVRHLSVHLLLTARPGQYETASRLLGHRQTATTRNAYLGLETDASVRLYEDAVLQAQKWAKSPTPKAGKGRGGRR
jgi:integrase